MRADWTAGRWQSALGWREEEDEEEEDDDDDEEKGRGEDEEEEEDDDDDESRWGVTDPRRLPPRHVPERWDARYALGDGPFLSPPIGSAGFFFYSAPSNERPTTHTRRVPASGMSHFHEDVASLAAGWKSGKNKKPTVFLFFIFIFWFLFLFFFPFHDVARLPHRQRAAS